MEWWLNFSFVELDRFVPLAQAAERAGFGGISFGDHLLYPQHIASRYPYSADGVAAWSPESHWPDAWVVITAMAMVTRRLRFASGVYIAPLRHPVNLAKALGTAASLSGGRVLAGLGSGWMKEEFDILGVPFEQRGARMDEMLEIMRLLWSGEMVSFKGRHFTLPPSQMSPAPGVPIPILIGGHAEPALRRAARHDGWVGVHYGFDETKAVVAKLRGMLERRDEERPFTIQMAMDRIHPDVAERFSEMRIDAAVLPLFGLAKGPSLDDQLDAIQRTGEELALSPQPG